MFASKAVRQPSRLILAGRVTVETKGDTGEFLDGIQQQRYDVPGLKAD